jgi:hypothetical protein
LIEEQKGEEVILLRKDNGFSFSHVQFDMKTEGRGLIWKHPFVSHSIIDLFFSLLILYARTWK